MADSSTVFVALLDEGTQVWRPVAAEPAGAGVFRLIGSVPDGEAWDFQPGERVRCVRRICPDCTCVWVAAERAD
jgi:hypothetical protein